MGKASRLKKVKREAEAPWTEFVQVTHMAQPGCAPIPVPEHLCLVRNNKYQVMMALHEPREPFGEIIWLSIKRVDRLPIHDWRDLQRIKNELIGEEVEAVEVYPAESRVVDTSNQYHLWCFRKYKLPFGYTERLLIENPHGGAVQRPWKPWERPADIMTNEQAIEAAEARGVPTASTEGRWRKG